jgi:adenylate cyclase
MLIRWLICWCCFLFSFQPGRAQTKDWPSDLVALWESRPSDTERWQVFFEYLDTSRLDVDRQTAMINAALERIRGARLQAVEAEALRQLGIRALDQEQYDQASQLFVQSLGVFQAIGDSSGMTMVTTNLGTLEYHRNQFPTAILYWKGAIAWLERHPDATRQATIYGNLGAAYSQLNRLDSARYFHAQSLALAREANDARATAEAYNNLGVTAEYSGRLNDALDYYERARTILDSLQDVTGLVRSYLNISYVLESYGRTREAYDMNRRALELIPRTGNPSFFRLAYLNLANVSYKLGLYREAYDYLVKHQTYKDSLTTLENTRILDELQLQKRAGETALASEQGTTASLRQRQQRLLLIGSLLLTALIAALGYTIWRNKRRTEELLFGVLPRSVARELRLRGSVAPRQHEQCSVLFAGLIGFDEQGRSVAPDVLVGLIDRYYQAFEQIVVRHGIEKMKTIGDAFMCAAGVPNPVADHAAVLVRAAREMLAWVEQQRNTAEGARTLQLRIGIHSGPVVSGVVGVQRYAYDIWGDTVSIAVHLEERGLPGEITISEATAELIKGRFALEAREPAEVPGIGRFRMFLVGQEQG